jgi:hypothetical protein
MWSSHMVTIIEEGVYSSFRVKEAVHGIELAKVKCENFQSSCSWVWGWKCCDVSASQAQNKITG